ncbi:MAG: carboxymuconolactone decarboxylase family protein [Methanobacteriaceae archaeon]
MNKNPFEIFIEECPELAAGFNRLVEIQRETPGLDSKTKQLVNIAIQTSNRNVNGVKMHAHMARKLGATRDEVKGAVVLNLHLSGLNCVLDCLPAALDGYEIENL